MELVDQALGIFIHIRAEVLLRSGVGRCCQRHHQQRNNHQAMSDQNHGFLP